MAVSNVTLLSGVPIALNASIGPLASCKIFSAELASQLSSVSPPSAAAHQTDSPELFTNASASMCPDPLPQCPVVATAIGEPDDLSHLPNSDSVTFLVTTSNPSLPASDGFTSLSALVGSLVDFELSELAALVLTGAVPDSFPLGQAANNLGRSAENSSASSVACTTLASYSRFA